MRNLLILIILMFSSLKSLCNSTSYSIIGTVDSDIEFLLLYKFENLFNRKLIAKIPVIDSSFYYSINLTEIETYQLQQPSNTQSLMFIWDGNITYKINSKNLYLSKVFNSPLTRELNILDSVRLARFIEPIWKLDTLLLKAESLNDLQIKALKSKRDSVFDACQLGYKAFDDLYIKNNPDSFISLLKITYVGTFFISNEDRQMINSLSDRLKKHSRYKKFLGG